ncbi:MULTISPECIES: alpha-L-fucosidase [Eisenbergiella]|uniref:alpha-L-fucosidase n=1 Tax=Eisenbergiella TaxID=1432051 RepID=UPI001A9AF6D8|nr:MULTISPECIES: alpha-L-fucosidase [Eisenbergiella]MDY2655280.1 alpha-L-fucosidase [Eisenbergiella porci]
MDIGSREFIQQYDELIWYPAEVDVSIRPSWGYMKGEAEKLHSLDTLINMYEKAVGGNANLLLNVPPTQRDCLMKRTWRALRKWEMKSNASSVNPSLQTHQRQTEREGMPARY